MLTRFRTELRHARLFTLKDPADDRRCQALTVFGDRDGVVHVSFHVPDASTARTSVLVTAAGPQRNPEATCQDDGRTRRLAAELVHALTDPRRAAHLTAVAARQQHLLDREAARRQTLTLPCLDKYTPRTQDMAACATVLLTTLTLPVETRLLTLAMLASEPTVPPQQLLAVARAATASGT